MKYLAYINSATSEKSSTVVEVTGLSDPKTVPLPTESNSPDIQKTVLAVTIEDSQPERKPVVPKKNVCLSVDIKLEARLYKNFTEDTKLTKENADDVIQVQPKQAIQVKLDAPTGYFLDTMEIWHVKDNGLFAPIRDYKLIQEDGKTKVTFSITSFSDFVFYAEKKPDPIPEKKPSSGGGFSGQVYIPPTIPKPDHGSVSIFPAHPDPGDKVTVTPKPNKDYVVDKVKVTDRDGKPVPVEKNPDGTFTYTHPKGKATIEVTFRPAKPGPDYTGVDRLLNTDAAKPYLNGFADGTFGPYRHMTRAQVAQMFYNLLKDQNVATTAHFGDIPEGAWCEDAVNTLQALGIMNGVTETRFDPNRPITRSEFVVTAMRFAKAADGGENRFTDVSEEDWFYPQLMGAVSFGWIGGYQDGTFRPRNPVTRAEVAVITNRMLGRHADGTETGTRSFTDVGPDCWAQDDILAAANGLKP